MRLNDWLLGLIRRRPRKEHAGPAVSRGPIDHVIILDGTMSTLEPGCESNAGLTFKLLQEVRRGAALSLYYEAGIQWRDWRAAVDVSTGRGINRQIRRAYGALASRYRPGDRIFLIGYSRGAYAVRSLAGVIDRVGLLRAEHATERNVRQIYRHYETSPDSDHARRFAQAHCHLAVEIEMVGVWDTVKALGLRLPVFWRWAEERHAFHNHHLGPTIRHGFHALARDETRLAYAPVLWASPDGWQGHMEQVWFRGTHGDVGGQLGGFHPARPLANIPLCWMLEKIAMCGVALPDDWQARFPRDPDAPSVGTWRGWGKLFIFRTPRRPLLDRSESFHPTALAEPRSGRLSPLETS